LAHFQDVTSPILDDNEALNGKLLDAAIKKIKLLKTMYKIIRKGLMQLVLCPVIINLPLL
jgi:hypothetical protein